MKAVLISIRPKWCEKIVNGKKLLRCGKRARNWKRRLSATSTARRTRRKGKSIEEGAIMQGNKKLNEKRIHPTQKPVALYRWIFKNYAKPGDRILDTHLGSGSSRIAAYDAGLDFVGCEIDPTYFKLQEERFNEYTAQQSLFVMEGRMNDVGIERTI